jgi:glutaredoxin
MTKELLSKHNVDFESLDIEKDPAARDELRALGITSLPVVMVGERYLVGWNPARLAELVGLNLVEQAAPADELVASIRMLLEATLRLVRQVPDEHLMMKSPDRDRPLRQLAHHVFHVAERAVDADILGNFAALGGAGAGDIAAHTSAARIARYGKAVEAKFNAWFSQVDSAAFSRQIETFNGPRSVGQVFERSRSHMAQHLRQLYVFLEWIGVEPEYPLTADDLKNIDLPQSVW